MTDGWIDAALLAGLQHEVLNPLTGALGVLDAMRDLPMSRPATGCDMCPLSTAG